MHWICVLLMSGLLLSTACYADQKFYVHPGNGVTFRSYATKGAGHDTWSFSRPDAAETTFFSSSLYPTFYYGRDGRLQVHNLNITSDVCVEYELDLQRTIYTDAGRYSWNTSSTTCALAVPIELEIVLTVQVREPVITCFLPLGRSGYCQASVRTGLPVPRITWRSDDPAVTISRNVTDISHSGYVVSRVSWPQITHHGFEGKYIECNVVQTTESGEDIFPMTSKYELLRVSNCPSGPPIISPIGGPLTLDYGDTLDLSCASINGFPQPTLAWFQDETQLSALQCQRLNFTVAVVADSSYRCTSVSELAHCPVLESVISVSIRGNGSVHDPTHKPPNDINISMGAVLGTVIAILLLILIVYCIWSRRRLNAAGRSLPLTTSSSLTNNINTTNTNVSRGPLPNPEIEMDENFNGYTQFSNLPLIPSEYGSHCFSNSPASIRSTYLHSPNDEIGDVV